MAEDFAWRSYNSHIQTRGFAEDMEMGGGEWPPSKSPTKYVSVNLLVTNIVHVDIPLLQYRRNSRFCDPLTTLHYHQKTHLSPTDFSILPVLTEFRTDSALDAYTQTSIILHLM